MSPVVLRLKDTWWDLPPARQSKLPRTPPPDGTEDPQAELLPSQRQLGQGLGVRQAWPGVWGAVGSGK